jgi:hypothetical protein
MGQETVSRSTLRSIMARVHILQTIILTIIIRIQLNSTRLIRTTHTPNLQQIQAIVPTVVMINAVDNALNAVA